MDQTLEFNPDLINRYNKSGPRYTSYPTAVQFHQGFTKQQYINWAAWTNEQCKTAPETRPLSLYFHIPFCDTVCYYCGCSKVVTKNRDKAAPYLSRLYREIEMQSQLFDNNRMVDQLHWGGGTPTFISHQEMTELMRVTRENFQLHEDDSGEYSIEIDPREVENATIALLRQLGFNRMSLGVQDFDERVQKAVNRIQSEEKTLSVIHEAKKQGFKSISIDLIYGLPFQSVDSFNTTLEKVIQADPDRLSIFNYAHLPEMFKPQRRINESDLPEPSEKLEILHQTIERLTKAGYVYIGMDHFAKPEDELAIAQRKENLYRNFQGYSTHADCDLVALGITSIGKVGHCYSQNVKTLDEYFQKIDNNELPVFRGIEFSGDDILRQNVITQLICHFKLDISKIESQYKINFLDYFKAELDELQQFVNDGLVTIDNDAIQVLSVGRLLIRNICMVFDNYIRSNDKQQFSKVI